MNNQPKPIAEAPTEHDNPIELLYDELRLAMQWQKPAHLMAISTQTDTQEQAMQALRTKLERDNYAVETIDTQQTEFYEFLRLAFDPQANQNKVYFIVNLTCEAHNIRDEEWQSFYAQQNALESELIRVVFWMPAQHLQTLVAQSPALWENRYRVVELENAPATQPSASQQELNLDQALQHETQENLTLGVNEWRNGELDRAYQYLNNAVDLSDVLNQPNARIQTRQAYAMVLMEMKLFHEAIEIYNAILQIEPTLAQGWKSLGQLHLKLEHLNEAEAAFRQAITNNPQDANSWIGLASVLEKKGAHTSALDSYRRAIQIVPHFTLAWLKLGNVLEALKQPQNAIKAYNTVIKLDARQMQAWARLAQVCHKQGKSDETQRVIEKALEQNGGTLEDWLILGDLAIEHSAYPLAAESYRRALVANPRDGQAYCKLAQAQHKLGNITDAINCYEMGINFLEEEHSIAQAWKELIALLNLQNASPAQNAPAQPRPAKSAQQILQHGTPAIIVDESAFEQIPASETGIPLHNATPQPHTVQEIFAQPEREPAHLAPEAVENTPAMYFGSMRRLPAWYWDASLLAKEVRRAHLAHSTRTPEEHIQLLIEAGYEQPRAEIWHTRHAKPLSEKSRTEPVLESTPPARDERGARAWVRQGMCLLEKGLRQDAINAFESALSAHNGYLEAYLQLAHAHTTQGDYDQALNYYYKSLEYIRNAEEKSAIWNEIGNIYRHQHDRHNALQAFQKADSVRPAPALRQRARQVLVFGNC
jgi:tetratricopeptide (TPR) repeat protein